MDRPGGAREAAGRPSALGSRRGEPSPHASVMVSLGTDHHAFERLVRWVDAWVASARSRGGTVRYTLQHGATAPSALAMNVALLPRHDMLHLFAEHDLLVVQGGPGSIRDVRSVGRVPIVVPRRRDQREVVDDHQIDFARFMAARGECALAEDGQELAALLDRYASDPAALRRPAPPTHADATAEEVRRALQATAGRPVGGFDARAALHALGRMRQHRMMHR